MCPPARPNDIFPSDYCLVAPQHAQVQISIGPQFDNLIDFFSAKESPWLWSTFARPVEGATRTQCYHRRVNAAPTRLEQLPNELLGEIVENLYEDKKDVLAFGLSSNLLWPVVLRHVHRDFKKTSASWAGAVVAFQGSFSRTVPETFKTEGCDQVLSPQVCGGFNGWKTYYYERLGRFSGDKLQKVECSEQEWRNTLAVVKGWNEFCHADWTNIGDDLSNAYLYPQDRVWLLRNLSNQEFIRSDELAPKELVGQVTITPRDRMKMLKSFFSWKRVRSRSTPPYHTTPVTFAQVFLLMACHSSNPHWHEYNLRFHQGVWAGDRFDIVTLDDHSREEEPGEWTNVSEPVVNDVANLRWWASQYAIQNYQGRMDLVDEWPAIRADREKYHCWRGKPEDSVVLY